MKTLGLIGTSQQGHDYDRFRGRVIFPIMNSSGKVIAFGGRDLKGGPAKYINSPESDLYKKSNELYGMHQARSAIAREDRCFLVEGYLDVIGMWQAGMKNVVASSGTALTDNQIALIHRFTKKVTLIYDGDAAGIKASLRGIDMLLSHQLDVKVLLLPDGDDPDSFARKHTPEEFREYVKANETDIIRFKTMVLMNEVKDDPQRRIEAIRSVVQSLACIPDKVKRDVYIQECSRILGVSEESIGAATAKARAAVVENFKRERNQRDLNNHIESGRIEPQPSLQAITSLQQSPRRPGIAAVVNPLQPLEWEVLEYCIKYGYLDFCDGIGQDGEEVRLNVIEYVTDEIEADEITFSVSDFGKVFKLLQSMLPDFREALASYYDSLLPEINAMRENGIRNIGEKATTVDEIEREEKKLEEQIEEWTRNKIADFSKSYPSKELASHEDDMVRTLTTNAISERHHLSQIYSRERPAEKEEDKLLTLIPTAITVWKNGILDLKFNNLLREFRVIAGKGETEKENEMQAKLAELIKIRSEVAKNIGDRIIYPGNKGARSARISNPGKNP